MNPAPHIGEHVDLRGGAKQLLDPRERLARILGSDAAFNDDLERTGAEGGVGEHGGGTREWI
jgi:hypothetical protein